MRVICVLISAGEKNIPQMAESFYRLTPQIALREGEAIFLEVGSCKRLYKEETLFLKIQALMKRFGVRGRMAVADDPALSLCLAKYTSNGRGEREASADAIGNLPLEALHDVASPFKKDEFIFKQIEQLIVILRKLGVRSLGEFLKLPSGGLSSRFRALGLTLHRRLTESSAGETKLLWPAFVPPEKIDEKMNLDGYENCQSLEPLLFLVKNLISRAIARLAGRSERVTKFELEMELEKNSLVRDSRRSWSFTLPLPQGSVTGLLPLIQERLQTDFQRQPLESEVVSLRLVFLETVPGQYGQKNFFNKREEEQEAWNSLLARLCQKLGKEHTFVASPRESYQPEKSWKKNWAESVLPPEALTGIDLPFPQRPLRLLKSPLPLLKNHNALVQNSTNKSWEIKDWEGPERLSGEWWGEGFKRDYFRVGTGTGEQLWVFRIPESDKLFLHGFFD